MDWITSGASQLEMTSIVKSLRTLRDTYKKRGNIDTGSGLKFIKWLVEQDTAGNFKTELDKLNGQGSTTDQVAQQLEKLVDKIQNVIPEKYQNLLYRLEQLGVGGIPSDIDFPVIDIDEKKKDFQVSEIALSLSGGLSASIIFEGNALDNPPQNSRGVSITCKGALQTKLEGSTPINTVGSISAFAGFSVKGSFSLHYIRPNTELFIDSLVHIFEEKINPFDLESIANNLDTEVKFSKAAMLLDGQFSYGGNMKLGFKNPVSPKAIVNASVDVGFTTTISGNFKLEVEPLENKKVNVSIRRITGRMDTTSFGFGVSVDASAVAKEVKKKADLYLEDVTGLFTSTIADVEKFVSPGDYLKGKMTELTKDLFSNTGINESIRKDLIASTQLAFGVTTKEEATQELTGQLMKALSSRVIIFEGSAQSRATELTTLIADKLGIKVSLIEGITTTIQTKLTELDTEFDNKINNAIVGKVTNWTDALGEIGIKVDKAVTSVDNEVEALRSSILKMLRHYQKKINDFTALITDENRYKLEAKFNSEVKRQNTTDLMLVYQFDLADPNANLNDLQKYYHMLMRGRADKIFDTGPVPGVKKIDSIETIESLLDKSKGLYVSLFGMELNNSSILDVNSKVVRNAAGDIVAMSDLKYREEFNFAGMLSRATFVDAFKINMAKHASVGINFDMLVSDIKLDHSELDNILDKLESFQLLPSDTREDIERDYLKMLGHKKQISTQLNFTLPFNDSQVKWLLSIGKGMSDNAIAKQCFVNAFNMEKDKVGLGLGESKALRLLEQASNIDGTMTDIMFAIDERSHKSFERACENHIKLPETAVKIRHIKKHADAFVDMIMSMREIYLYEGDNLQAQWLTDHQEIIGDSVDKWINTFADLTVLFSPKISAQTQCLVKLLIHLSGWDEKSRVALTTKAVYKDKSINYQ